MSGSAGTPSAEELAALPVPVLVARLAEALELIARLREVVASQGQQVAVAREQAAVAEEQAAVRDQQIEQLTVRVEQLERRARQDSSTSGKPPSSDSIYTKQPPKKASNRRDRSLRERTGRRPGKQPGDAGTTMRLVDAPHERVACPPAACSGCQRDLSEVPVASQQRRQVTDIPPPPPPVITEYLLQAKVCPDCGATSIGDVSPGVRARAQFGVEVHAQAANLVCGQHLPVWRSARLLGQLGGIKVSTGWVAGVRGKTAGLVEASGFLDRVGELLRDAPAIHADETPARANRTLRYVHLACTRYLTMLHTGSRSAEDIDAGGVLPGYTGIVVRDGYAGYQHLTDALHAWCGAHLLRDLKDLDEFEPAKQPWALAMAELLMDAKAIAAAARAAGQTALDTPVLDDLLGRYRMLAARGLADTSVGGARPRPTPAGWPAGSVTMRI